MSKPSKVEEMHGLYGPFSVSEKLIQKIWLRQDFLREGMRTLSGRQLTVHHPGRWNRQEGPDFLEAQLELDGIRTVGDVEIHFSASDWTAHSHSHDPNFDRVLLHVLLFQPGPKEALVRTESGRAPETFVLLQALERDLESYAMDQALLELEAQDELEWVANYLDYPQGEREAILRSRAQARWEQKCSYAQKRLQGADWAEVCHQYLLEVLGYARNRAPMSRLSLESPLADWQAGRVHPEDAFASQQGQWKLNGIRPLNHPRLRLQQYALIVEACPDWPNQLIAWAQRLPKVENAPNTRAFRQQVGMSQLIERLDAGLFNQQLGATRLNTLICDALLPLLQAGGCGEVTSYWHHWQPGDMPVALRRFLKYTSLTNRENPYSNGRLQGALSLSLTEG